MVVRAAALQHELLQVRLCGLKDIIETSAAAGQAAAPCAQQLTAVMSEKIMRNLVAHFIFLIAVSAVADDAWGYKAHSGKLKYTADNVPSEALSFQSVFFTVYHYPPNNT